ncbi:MAG: hypothetical protein PF589_03480 [Gammaproteobacteria bacterium]|jgi:hypothetical protein|nr:hypothetical protein [Gammaproteobacteria bacterium]
MDTHPHKKIIDELMKHDNEVLASMILKLATAAYISDDKVKETDNPSEALQILNDLTGSQLIAVFNFAYTDVTGEAPSDDVLQTLLECMHS